MAIKNTFLVKSLKQKFVDLRLVFLTLKKFDSRKENIKHKYIQLTRFNSF